MLDMTQAQKMIVLVCMAATSLIFFKEISDTLNSALRVQSSNEDETPFCKGMFMVMSMGGFQWSLVGREPGDCLSYFAPAWKLDSRGKFQGAMVYSFLLGILTEGSHAVPVLVRPYVPKRLAHLSNSILLGVERFMAYFIMLIAMMYSWELLISLICGIMVGRLMFPNVTRREWRKEARRLRSEVPSSHPTLAATLDESNHQGEDEPLLVTDVSMRRRR